jgi:hypothetical protein
MHKVNDIFVHSTFRVITKQSSRSTHIVKLISVILESTGQVCNCLKMTQKGLTGIFVWFFIKRDKLLKVESLANASQQKRYTQKCLYAERPFL